MTANSRTAAIPEDYRFSLHARRQLAACVSCDHRPAAAVVQQIAFTDAA